MYKNVRNTILGILAIVSFLKFAVFTPASDLGIILSLFFFALFAALFLWKTGIYKDIIDLIDRDEEETDN